MRTLVTVRLRGQGYVADVVGAQGGGGRGLRIGLTPDEAAIGAVNLMTRYALRNPEGGDLIAPEEVLNLVPEQWRNFSGELKFDEYLATGDDINHRDTLDAEAVGTAIIQIQDLLAPQAFTAWHVLKAASQPTSPLHRHFHWDDQEAAHLWRLHQAKALTDGVTRNGRRLYISMPENAPGAGIAGIDKAPGTEH